MTFGLYIFLPFGIEHAFAETDVFQKQIHCKHRKSIKKNMLREKNDRAGENVWAHPERNV